MNPQAFDIVGGCQNPATSNTAPALHDAHGRTVRYLRLSVTDRCNLRCLYCRSTAREHCIAHANILRYEEMVRVVQAAVGVGVEKIRLTGGEPFARRGFLDFLTMLKGQFPTVDVRITTNGTLVQPHIADLYALEVRAINVSLDSFSPAGFLSVTGRDLFAQVRSTLDAIMAQGIRLKINAVGLRGVNDGEMAAFLDFATHNPVDVRFIEFMPMGACTAWSTKYFWPAADILATAQRYATLMPLQLQGKDGNAYSGPARMYAIEGGQGRFGLITPMSSHFCSDCNRLRVTSDGFLRTCLFADKEYKLRGILRNPKLGIEAVQKVMLLANKVKPLGVELLNARKKLAVARKGMVSIGG